jgi:hypothetical protein
MKYLLLLALLLVACGGSPTGQAFRPNEQITTTVSPAELAQHNTAQDCWVSYKGFVYDITAWLPVHPGTSEAIEPYCGTSTEFEEAFGAQHGTRMEETLKEEGTYKGVLQ